jgi:hypothetical protein
MDSDDSLKLDALELTYNAAEEKQVHFVLFQAINYNDEKDQFYEAENYSMNVVAEKVGENIFSIDDIEETSFEIAVTPWTKLYNRQFIEDSHIRFAEGLIFEDNIFFWEVLLQAQRIYFLREHLFYRRWYETSSTMAGDLRFTDSIAINTMVIDVFEKYDYMTERFFKVKLKEVIPGKTLHDPLCESKVGTPPAENVDITEFITIPKIPDATNIEAIDKSEFYGDEEYDQDEISDFEELDSLDNDNYNF